MGDMCLANGLVVLFFQDVLARRQLGLFQEDVEAFRESRRRRSQERSRRVCFRREAFVRLLRLSPG